MEEILIRPLRAQEDPPMPLLLLADPSVSVIDSYIHRSHCFVAELRDIVVGVSVVIDTRPQTVELVNIAVAETEQGKGIGRQLVMHVIDWARRNGFQTIEIGTGNSSFAQLGLYQTCGFRIIGVDLDFFTRHYPEPIFENGLRCRDMIRLALEL